VVNWIAGLSNSVSNITRRYVDRMKFVVYMDFPLLNSFICFWFHFYLCIYGCMFCVLVFNFVNYLFLLLCLCIFIATE
jgi:hypothetical protein